MTTNVKETRRCRWAKTDLSIDYHDHEWGVAVHDDRKLFEFLVLEGAQAGLSWETILRKRLNYRRAFNNFEPARVAKYGSKQIERLMQDEGIIRNRLKIRSAIQNARAFLNIQKEFGSFDKYLWKLVEGKPVIRKRGAAVPVSNELSDSLSRDLKRRGFNFVGSTICYSFLQAVGVVNDHDTTCFRYAQLTKK